MGDWKQTLAKECDKVAWAVVALLIIVMIVARSVGGDPVRRASRAIERHLAAIEVGEGAQRVTPPEVTDVAGRLRTIWSASSWLGSGTEWLCYRKPALLAAYATAEIEFARHTAPVLERVSVLRDEAAKKPYVVVEGTAGEIAHARFTAIEVHRADGPEGTFVKVGEIPVENAGSKGAIRFEDRTIEPVPFNQTRQYAYKLRTVVRPEEGIGAEPDFKPVRESADVAKPITVPPDLQIVLVTVQQGDLLSGTRGEAYLRVARYDYDAGKVKRLTLQSYRPLEGVKPTEKDFIPGASLYVWIIQSGTQIKLKDWSTKKSFTLSSGDQPASPDLPPPWERKVEAPGGAEEPAAETKPGETKPAGTPATAPAEETPAEQPAGQAPAEGEEENPFK